MANANDCVDINHVKSVGRRISLLMRAATVGMVLLFVAAFMWPLSGDSYSDARIATRYISDAKLVGKGRLRYLGFNVYDAELYASSGKWQVDAPYVLTLRYLRVAGYRGLPKSMAYGPTKAALINLAETLHLELAAKGILVSVVNPGFVDTPATRKNPFPMPDLMAVEDAAQALINGLERGDYEIFFPRKFVYIMKFLRVLPNRAFHWIIRRRTMRG